MVWYPECLLENRKDSGYAFVVCFAAFLSRALILGLTYSSGIYYVELLFELRTTKSTAAWVGSLVIASVNTASILSSALLNRYGPRLTGALSAVIACFGLISSVFSTSIYYLFVSYGLIAGIGMGIALIPTFVTINDYFDKWKHVALSVASTGSSFGTFVGPVLVERWITYYGWRGSILLSAALVLNLGVLALLMRPFHESKTMPLMCIQGSTVDVKMMNWSLFKHKRYMCLCLTNASTAFTSSCIIIHLSAYAQLEAGHSAQRAAVILSLIGIMGMPSRLMYGVLISKNLSPFVVTIIASVTIGLMMISLPYIKSFSGLVVYSVVCGTFMSSSGGAVWPAMLTSLMGEANLSNTLGIMNCLTAIGSLSGPPVVGWLVDRFGTYEYAFILTGSLSLLAGVLNLLVWKTSAVNQCTGNQKKNEVLLVVERITSL